jgi:hypothetical protein
VNDIDQSVKFYAQHLGFALKQQFGPNMAVFANDDLTLWLAGAGRAADVVRGLVWQCRRIVSS